LSEEDGGREGGREGRKEGRKWMWKCDRDINMNSKNHD
jgi:hypothetical protein